jgi:hypothetical protein
MFTRTVEVTTQSGKAKELSNTLNDKVLPILKRQDLWMRPFCYRIQNRIVSSRSVSGIPKKMPSGTIGSSTPPSTRWYALSSTQNL